MIKSAFLFVVVLGCITCSFSKQAQNEGALTSPSPVVTNSISFSNSTVQGGIDSPAASDWPPSALAAVYSPTASPSFNSPEGVSRLLEQRWSLADIRTFCVPARRHNTMFQNLVVNSTEAWKGRLYSDRQTGFDRISWYATVRDGRVLEYSLEAYRGNDFWLLEIGSPETVRKPPNISPDISEPRFIEHK